MKSHPVALVSSALAVATKRILAPLPTAEGNLTHPTSANEGVAALANRTIEILLVLTVPLLLVGIIWSAFTLFKVTGKPDDIAKVKKNVGYIVLGLFFIIFAVILVRSFYGLFSNPFQRT